MNKISCPFVRILLFCCVTPAKRECVTPQTHLLSLTSQWPDSTPGLKVLSPSTNLIFFSLHPNANLCLRLGGGPSSEINTMAAIEPLAAVARLRSRHFARKVNRTASFPDHLLLCFFFFYSGCPSYTIHPTWFHAENSLSSVFLAWLQCSVPP